MRPTHAEIGISAALTLGLQDWSWRALLLIPWRLPATWRALRHFSGCLLCVSELAKCSDRLCTEGSLLAERAREESFRAAIRRAVAAIRRQDAKHHR